MRFKNTSNGDVIDVPSELGAMYAAREDWAPYDPQPGDYPELSSAVTAPAGSTGAPVPQFDPDQPLMAGPVQALEHLEDIKGAALDNALTDLGLDDAGKADDKRDRLAARLTEEVKDA